MFAHYSANHTGVCLQFATATGSFFASAKPVTYQSRFPTLDFAKTKNPQAFRKLFFTKSSEWQYEKEWRVLDRKDGYGAREYDGRLLTGVIFGLRASRDEIHRVKSWLLRRGHPVNMFQAAFETGRYRLKHTLIDRVRPRASDRRRVSRSGESS